MNCRPSALPTLYVLNAAEATEVYGPFSEFAGRVVGPDHPGAEAPDFVYRNDFFSHHHLVCP